MPVDLLHAPELSEAWKDALAGDPVSAYGGILITNREMDHADGRRDE